MTRNRVGRPDRFVGGFCERGHDITLPENLGMRDSGGKFCQACKRDRNREWARAKAASTACMICGKPKPATANAHTRTCSRACMGELSRRRNVGQPTKEHEHQPTSAACDYALDLLRLAEDALPWERDEMRAEAARVLAARRAVPVESVRTAHGVRRRNRGTHTRDRASAPLRDGRDGGAVGAGDEAAAERPEGGGTDTDGAGSFFQRNTGSRGIQ